LRPSHFADRLAALTEERRSRVVLGLDPDPSRLWPQALARIGGSRSETAEARAGRPPADAAVGYSPHLARIRTAEAVTEHCRAAIVAAGPACVAVKPQLACFERLGAPGWESLEQVAAIARDHGLLVLADGKRGDVPVTARAYAQALVGETEGPFGAVQGLGADAFTANPLLGRDAIGPLVEVAAERGAGCFLLVRTSNPGAAELQDTGDPPLHERLARLVDELGAEWLGECGLSCVGAVTGATRPDHLARLRELMPRAIFLLPGVGAQGGRVEDLGPAFAPHPAAGLVTASRSIVDAHLERGGEPAVAAEAAAEDLRASAWNL
jgi:orotidine-5'-phosphate decarboxylase